MKNKKLILSIAPVIIMLVLLVVFWEKLERSDVQAVSSRQDKPFPAFKLASLHNPEQVFTEADLPKTPHLVNVWATWCVSCHVEHPYLVKFANQVHVPMVGLNYKDRAKEALQYLQKGGDPYVFSLFDDQGVLAIELGVQAAPETFVLDHKGIIRMRYLGVIDDRVWETMILPKLKELNQIMREEQSNTTGK